jgi:hypothetical protein
MVFFTFFLVIFRGADVGIWAKFSLGLTFLQQYKN